MPPSRVKQGLVLVLVAVAAAWSLFGDQIQSVVRSDHGCPNSNALAAESNQAEGRAAILCLLNKERAKRGLPALVEDRYLEAAAQRHAEDMGRRNFYAHRNPDGEEPDQRIRAAGYRGRTTGENIHWGVRLNATPAKIFEDWMNSPGHKANILRRSFTRVGTGIGYDPPEQIVRGQHVGVYVNNFGG